jgi:RNA polymerase sigma-70 factor (ECF subfamily)
LRLMRRDAQARVMEGSVGIAPPCSAECDLDVITRVLDGDDEAFDILLRRHGDRVFQIVARRVRAEDVESVAQEIFVAAFRSLRTYRGKQPFENWLACIARRRCCDYWRCMERRVPTAAVPLEVDQRAWLEQVSSGLSVEAFERECERKEAVEVMQAAMAQLDAEDRALIESIYFEDVPLREVAATFGWSLAKVKVRAYRVRNRLHRVIERMFESEAAT